MPSSDHETPSGAPAIDTPPNEFPPLTVAPLPEYPWTIWNVFGIAVIMVISLVFFTEIAMIVARLSLSSTANLARNPIVVLPAMAAAYCVMIATMVVTVRTSGRPFWTTIQWNFPSRTAIGYAALGLSLAILVGMTSKLLPIPKSLPIDSYFTDARGAFAMATFGVTFAPLCEELFFRGFLYPVIARRWGAGVSVGLTAACFALIHQAQLANAWAPLLLVWFVGLVLTAVRAWTRSVGASFCVHAGYNLTLFTLMYIATDHFRHLEKLT